MTVTFQKASRKQLKLKLAMTGPAGSGKTFSALEIASGFGGKIVVIDTENKSASIYSGRYEFSVFELDPPFTVERYVEAMRAAVETFTGPNDVLIVDSGSHQWAGEGGILDKKNKLDKRGGNSFTNWADLTPEHNSFLEFILRAPIHMIVTLRSKVEYVIEQNERGKSVPRKVGLAPITREGLDFELTTVLEMDSAHQAVSTKDRTGLFPANHIFTPSRKTGQQLVQWLNSGAAPAQPPFPPVPAQPPPSVPSPAGVSGSQGEGAVPHDEKPVMPINPEMDGEGLSDADWNVAIEKLDAAIDLNALEAVSKEIWKLGKDYMTKAQVNTFKIYGKKLREYHDQPPEM